MKKIPGQLDLFPEHSEKPESSEILKSTEEKEIDDGKAAQEVLEKFEAKYPWWQKKIAHIASGVANKVLKDMKLSDRYEIFITSVYDSNKDGTLYNLALRLKTTPTK